MNLAVENCLISDIPTILTPSIVIRMSEEQLKKLASESKEVQMKRDKLQQEVKILRAGLKECQRFRPAERTGASSALYRSSESQLLFGRWLTLRQISASWSISKHPFLEFR